MINTTMTRQLLKAKHYYLTVVLSLAFTLSMVFAVFSILDAVYLKPLPYGDVENLYSLDGLLDYQGTVQEGTNPPALVHVKKNSALIEQMAIYSTFSEQQISSFPHRPEVPVFYVSPDFFQILQVKPVLGRLFDDTENVGNKQPSAVLSYQAWQHHFRGSDEVIGKNIQLNHQHYTIVGVTPDNWVLPNYDGVAQAIWVPRDTGRRIAETFQGFTDSFKSIVRLKAGVSEEELLTELKPLYYTGAELSMHHYAKLLSPTPRVTSFIDAVRGDSATITIMLVAGVLLLIVIALVNLGNLQMARAAGRVQTLAISFAFGATRKQIFKELFQHNLATVSVAVVMGLLLTTLSFELIKRLAGDALPRMDTLGLSIGMLMLAILLTLLISALFSWIELGVANEKQLRSNLQSSGKGTGKQMPKGVSHALIGLQFCFSVITLVASVLVLHATLSEALRPSQIRTDNLWYIELGLGEIDNKEERINLNRSVMQHFRSRPDIKDVSYSSEMRTGELNRNFVFNESNEQLTTARRIRVDINHLRLLGMAIEGRDFKADDYELEFYPIIINQRLAEYLPDGAIGQKLILDDKRAHEIIGVAVNANFPGASFMEGPEVYLPVEYTGWRSSVLLLNVNPEFNEFSRRETLAELLKIDPRLDLKTLIPVKKQLSDLSKNHRFAAYIAAALAAVSLVMVIAGIAGMVSYMLNMRRFDLGVKIAMGATNNTLLRAQLLELSLPLATSMLLAFSLIFFALGYSRTIPDWLFAIQWPLIGYVLLTLAMIVAIACFIPTRMILKTEPIKALRNE